MKSGSISVPDLAGGFDLQSTLESAQTFLWQRADDGIYESTNAYGGDAWYYTVAGDDVVYVRQRNGVLEWQATIDAEQLLYRRLRLDDDLDAIFDALADDSMLEQAYQEYSGLRIVHDPFFPCVISFICSARMRVKRIHAIQIELARTFGDPLRIEETTYYSFPRPEQLAAASESNLRNLGLGFRAPYIQETAEMIATGELPVDDIREKSYEDAHEAVQVLPGVGPKIADCVALFALGHLRAVPIDTWTRQLIKLYYPMCDQGSYEATADAFRSMFGKYASYAQTYLYHNVRS
ncbi:DNA-3-methyladenine glycosylase family protein [Haladaptatus salinisoli]|uniref:DNA-3-methyladenine glycosylase family protein n=1 Tax=Haladaptatus salinisoli TaxID=2884876 RepID=UPI001D09D09E|nr:DNA glycosylase [Haladaptatus salinisoli]